MQSVEFKISGLKEALAVLKALPSEIVSKRGGPIRAALRKAAQPILKEAILNIRRIIAEPNIGGLPSKSLGALEASMRITILKFKGAEAVSVGPRKIKQIYAKTKANVRKGRVGKTYKVLPPTYYAWFLEYGTERMRPHPFLRPAFDSKKVEAANLFASELNTSIGKIVKKLEREKGVIK